MAVQRIVQQREANEVQGEGVTIQEYFARAIPHLGLVVATMNGAYPPATEGTWALNRAVDEMFYVLSGSAKIVYYDGVTIEVEPDSAVLLPLGMKYRVEDARGLHIVVATGPAWYPEQHKFS